MTGEEFRAIRMANQISQIDLSAELGYRTADTLRRIEKSNYVPLAFVEVLSKILRVDFNKKENVASYIREIPESIFHKYKVIRTTRMF